MSSLFQDMMESMEELPTSEYPTRKERYADFRQLFMGTDQGKRVYRELLSWGKMFNVAVYTSPVDPYRMAMFQGYSNFAKEIMIVTNAEPAEQPTKTRKK